MTQNDASSPTQSPIEDESTGLPGLRKWPWVYLVVTGFFALWVALMFALERAFS
jgi:hypothetical protein